MGWRLRVSSNTGGSISSVPCEHDRAPVRSVPARHPVLEDSEHEGARHLAFAGEHRVRTSLARRPKTAKAIRSRENLNTWLEIAGRDCAEPQRQRLDDGCGYQCIRRRWYDDPQLSVAVALTQIERTAGTPLRAHRRLKIGHAAGSYSARRRGSGRGRGPGRWCPPRAGGARSCDARRSRSTARRGT